MALCLAPGIATGQALPDIPIAITPDLDPSTLSDAELLDLLQRLEQGRAARPRPVGIFGIPSGFGVPRGVGFAALALTNRRDRARLGDWDASIALGFGLGDPDNGIGITPTIDITSVSPRHFGSSGKLGLSLSRSLPFGPRWRGSAALDLANLVTWGDSTVLDRDWNLAVSAVRPAGAGGDMPLMISLGYGSGVSDRGTTDGFFAGVGAGLSDSFGVSLGWFGDEAIAGVNVWPGAAKNLQISLGLGDITDRVSGRRFLLAVSIALPFGSAR